jgi:hypothetical protein
VAKELDMDFEEQLTKVLREYKDLFAWSYEDMKGLNPEFYDHKINLAKDAIPVQQWRYRLNPNYAAKVKEEIDKLLRVDFIRPIKRATWLSLIVVVPKKNNKLRVYVDYRKIKQQPSQTLFRFRLWMAYSTR